VPRGRGSSDVTCEAPVEVDVECCEFDEASARMRHGFPLVQTRGRASSSSAQTSTWDTAATMNDRDRLLEKLRRIEALYAGAATDGERAATDTARQRIAAKLQHQELADPPVEYRFTLDNAWSRKLFLALLRRYGIRPYRYPRQRRTTVMAHVSQAFVDDTLWPEFEELSRALEEHLHRITDDIIRQAIAEDASDAEEVAGLLEDNPS